MEQYFELMLGEDVADSIELLRENLIEINYSTSIHYECEGHIKDINVKIVDNYSYDEETNQDVVEEIGEVKINFMRHISWMGFEEAYDFCDIISQNFVDGFDACFKDSDSRSKTKFSLEEFSEYIYIDLFRINEKNRGMGIGSAVIHEIIDTIGKPDSLFVVIPFAIDDRENKASHKRVKKFWENLGFKRMGKTSFYYFSEKLINYPNS